LLEVKQLIEESFPVVCLKNGYNSKFHVKGSGYRDLKLLVEVEFDNLFLKKVPLVQPKTKLICEIQLICEKWLENKKTTSLSYKVLRARSLVELLTDFSKYLDRVNGVDVIEMPEAKKVLKNGWINMAKCSDFSDLNVDQLLMEAARVGWEISGVKFLIQELDANVETVNDINFTPAIMAARWGHENVLHTLATLKADLEAGDEINYRPLHRAVYWNHENCVRLLIDARCSPHVKTDLGQSAIDMAERRSKDDRILKLLRGEHVPLLKTKSIKSVPKMDQVKIAVAEGSLTSYLDTYDPESHWLRNF